AYAVSLPNRQGGVRISPGDTLGFAVGAALAASPTASLSADFNFAFASDAKANGVKIPGSDQVVGIFEIGAATALTPRLVLEPSLGFGVTQNAPNFIISVSFPYRF